MRAPAAARPAPPLDEAGFAALAAALGPFERAPRLAVAVSGGPDSLALCLLADRWARARGGEILGLTVDHGLRADSAAEAALTSERLRARGIAHEILAWQGPKPASGIQAAAREARYALLAARCRAAGILHLLVAHHRDDQIETVAFRVRRGSGPDGLAGMPAIREMAGLRLLRPLLGVPKERLRAILEQAGQPWLDDPSNRAPRFARTGLRAEALDGDRLERTAIEHAARRAALDVETARWLVRHARIDPAGFVLLSRPALRAAPPGVARRAVVQTLGMVGGGDYPPRGERLERLLAALAAAGPVAGRTLAGCRIVDDGDRVLICREAGAIRERTALGPDAPVLWDRRFLIRLRGDAAGLELRALGQEGVRSPCGTSPGDVARRLPGPVRASLPALWRGGRPVAVPHLGIAAEENVLLDRLDYRFCPARPVAGARFAGEGTYRATLEHGRSLLRAGETLC